MATNDEVQAVLLNFQLLNILFTVYLFNFSVYASGFHGAYICIFNLATPFLWQSEPKYERSERQNKSKFKKLANLSP